MLYKLKIHFYEKENNLLYEVYTTEEDVKEQFNNDDLYLKFKGDAEETKDGVEFHVIDKSAIKKFTQIEAAKAEDN